MATFSFCFKQGFSRKTSKYFNNFWVMFFHGVCTVVHKTSGNIQEQLLNILKLLPENWYLVYLTWGWILPLRLCLLTTMLEASLRVLSLQTSCLRLLGSFPPIFLRLSFLTKGASCLVPLGISVFFFNLVCRKPQAALLWNIFLTFSFPFPVFNLEFHCCVGRSQAFVLFPQVIFFQPEDDGALFILKWASKLKVITYLALYVPPEQ